MTSKTKINTVSVPFAELLKFAAAPKMKRMPRGVKGHIEKHTIIEFHPTFLVVETFGPGGHCNVDLSLFKASCETAASSPPKQIGSDKTRSSFGASPLSTI